MTDTAARPTGQRWGADDERGALNLLDPATVLAATQTPKTGVVYNLGLPVQRSGVPVFDYRGAPQRLTLTGAGELGAFKDYGAPEDLGANEDTLVIPAHNGTHMDALSHVFAEGKMYNGFDAKTFTASNGAAHCGIEKTGGFAARAVLLDVAGHQGVDWLEPGTNITGDDLEATRAAQGVEIRRGDVVLIRTGWLDLFSSLPPGESPPFAQPGVGRSTVAFFDDHDVSAVGADNAAIECIPFDNNEFLAVHIELLVKRGVTLIEHLVLSKMAADRCHEALFIAAPMLVTGASGSPLNPIAIG
ncbi:MAG: putative cyclase [Acidimicrobiales bacterium]|nr:putative cyclase [Acidimicrobiales bacterium]